MMARHETRASVLAGIQDLAAEEHALFARKSLDQCWDRPARTLAARGAGATGSSF
jgi:hypothetical protein